MQMNAEVFRHMSVIAEDEGLMKRAVKYLRKLAAERLTDSTQMTEEEFFAKIERAEQAYERGECHEMLPGEDLVNYLKRRGYEI